MNLTQLVTDARTKEFGDDTGTEQFPSQFFNHSVTVAAPNGQTTPRNPRFCATNFGARRLAEALNQYNDPRLQCTDSILKPAQDLQGGWSDSEYVPWLQFRVSGLHTGMDERLLGRVD